MVILLMLLSTSGLIYTRKKELELLELIRQRRERKILEEKALGLDATNWMKEKLEGAIAGDDELSVRTELVGGHG